MVEPSKEMRPIFASTIIKEDEADYYLVSIDPEEDIVLPKEKTFFSITYDYNETSLILRHSDWVILRKKLKDYKEDGPYTLITFDIVLDLSLVGYLSVVSSLLAENGISIYAISTFLRDHILVKKKDADTAVRLLNELVEKSKIY
jgi:hypothetical protein